MLAVKLRHLYYLKSNIENLLRPHEHMMWVQSGSQQEKGNQHSKLIHWYLVWLVPVKDLTIHFCFGFDRFALGKECLVHPALFALCWMWR